MVRRDAGALTGLRAIAASVQHLVHGCATRCPCTKDEDIVQNLVHLDADKVGRDEEHWDACRGPFGACYTPMTQAKSRTQRR